MSIPERGLRERGISHALDDWEVIAVTSYMNDNVRLWHVFKRSSLSFLFQTFATVILDTKQSKQQKWKRYWIKCSIWVGDSSNRMLRVHESVVLSFIKDTIEFNEQSENEFQADDYINKYWNTVNNGTPGESDVSEVLYASSRFRNSFRLRIRRYCTH